MSESTIVAIVGLLAAALSGVGFWGWLQNRKEAPIKKRDADVAAAHTSQQMALAIANRLDADVARLSTDVDRERTAREELGTKVQKLQDKVDAQADTIQSLRRAVRAFRDAWANLTANWHILRLQDNPPQQPYIDLKEEAS